MSHNCDHCAPVGVIGRRNGKGSELKREISMIATERGGESEGERDGGQDDGDGGGRKLIIS